MRLPEYPTEDVAHKSIRLRSSAMNCEATIGSLRNAASELKNQECVRNFIPIPQLSRGPNKLSNEILAVLRTTFGIHISVDDEKFLRNFVAFLWDRNAIADQWRADAIIKAFNKKEGRKKR